MFYAYDQISLKYITYTYHCYLIKNETFYYHTYFGTFIKQIKVWVWSYQIQYTKQDTLEMAIFFQLVSPNTNSFKQFITKNKTLTLVISRN